MARGYSTYLDARWVPKGSAEGRAERRWPVRHVLIDFRRMGSRVPSYKRSTREVMARKLQGVEVAEVGGAGNFHNREITIPQRKSKMIAVARENRERSRRT
jgi:hypothetical protein